jgi:hypothetical protein
MRRQRLALRLAPLAPVRVVDQHQHVAGFLEPASRQCDAGGRHARDRVLAGDLRKAAQRVQRHCRALHCELAAQVALRALLPIVLVDEVLVFRRLARRAAAALALESRLVQAARQARAPAEALVAAAVLAVRQWGLHWKTSAFLPPSCLDSCLCLSSTRSW